MGAETRFILEKLDQLRLEIKADMNEGFEKHAKDHITIADRVSKLERVYFKVVGGSMVVAALVSMALKK